MVLAGVVTGVFGIPAMAPSNLVFARAGSARWEDRMPIHFEDLDVLGEVEGVRSALIVPCNMCPAVTVAVREQKPFMNLFRSLLKSMPFDRYLKALRSRLGERGVKTTLFKSPLYHHWFMCMWTARKREKLRKCAGRHDAVLVLGCRSATETVRDALGPAGCKVIECMEVTGITNAEMSFRLPGRITFENCKTVPMARLGVTKEAPA